MRAQVAWFAAESQRGANRLLTAQTPETSGRPESYALAARALFAPAVPH
jgi:hypothetical protein